jgi:PBP1b-binding outer membrane lipoprotein LpoB
MSMKKMFAMAAAALVLSGCVMYPVDYDYGDGYRKSHPHGCPPGQAKKGNC